MELTDQTPLSKSNVTTQNSALLSALEQLKSSRTTRQKINNPLNVAVISIQRYLDQSNVGAKTDSCTDVYTYDLTVTDGAWKVKCKLSTTLHSLLHRNILRSGIDVRIVEFAIIYDERRLGQSFVRIDNLECTSEVSEVFRSAKDLDALSVWTNNDARMLSFIQMDLPLDAGRKHYLSLWNNEDPHGTVWTPNDSPVDVLFDVSKICLVADLESFYVRGKPPRPLLVRVMHKSRLRYYGKPTKNTDFPFQAYFEVADQSGTISMVLWNELCVEWYHRLNVGTELYLNRYSLKKAYQQRTRPQMNNSHMVFHSTEVSLNPETAVISVIPPRKVQPQWCLPEVSYLFHTRSEIENLADKAVVDVIGLVTFVGRTERVRSRANTVPERFWTYRWVHAVDGTSNAPFILEIFSTSQPDMFNSIHPMALLVCTQMRVCCGPGSHRYLTSSAETQIFTTGYHKNQPYQSQPKVKAFIQWVKTQRDRDMLTKCTVGGYYCCPNPQPTLALNTDQSSEPQILALEDLKGAVESLQYREHKRVIIQGHIVAVKYHTWPTGTTRLTQNAPQQQVEASVGVASTSLAPAVESEGPQTGRDTPVSSDSSSSAPRKRKTALPLKRQMKRHYMTRAQALSRRESPIDEPPEDEEVSEEEEEEEEEAPEQHEQPSEQTSQPAATGTGPQGSAEQSSVDSPDASWESSLSPLSTLRVSFHLRASGGLHRESVAEGFCFDDQELHLRQINLHPSRWSPELYPPQHATHPAAACDGYYTLTILGLNQQVAVDALFMPVWSSKDPRAASMSWSLHDNSLLSCLMSGHFCPPPNTSGSTDTPRPTPEEVMSSVASLEQEHMVCVLDICLLGDGKAEVICSRVFRTRDLITSQTSSAQ
ncbi:RPA-related protein RADX-like isoform X2 [Clupea harengus]|uniref:RPA-related protein RADX-like isoform X2 n=1 Tax=Clupea harengus TaxID=7950 RepID=A0A8M1K7W1_CLUHA|nr:RPA-related protein RADX-like isoform X2 [Clupea harengus]